MKIDGGYTKIPNEILEALLKAQLNSTQFKILLTIIRYTYGFQRQEHKQSVSFIAKATDSDTQAIRRGLNNLIEANLITVVTEATFKTSRVLKINEEIDTWNESISLDNRMIREGQNDSTSPITDDSTSPITNDSQEKKILKEKYKQREKTSLTSLNDSKKEKIEAYFNQIWDTYPRKRGKSKVSAKQRKHLFDEVPLEKMIQAIEKYKQETKGRPEEYIQHASSFFNGGYEDYMENRLKVVSKDIKPIKIGSYEDKIKQLQEAEEKKLGIR